MKPTIYQELNGLVDSLVTFAQLKTEAEKINRDGIGKNYWEVYDLGRGAGRIELARDLLNQLGVEY